MSLSEAERALAKKTKQTALSTQPLVTNGQPSTKERPAVPEESTPLIEPVTSYNMV